VHAADPALPVQVWRTPGHEAGAPYAQQPLLPCVHVARPPETHAVCPDEQLFVHVAEHAAFGDRPEQDSAPGHVDMESAYRQPSLSKRHVVKVCPFWHTAPVCVQMVEIQVHEGPPSLCVHDWWAPHAFEQGPPSAPLSAALSALASKLASGALASFEPPSVCASTGVGAVSGLETESPRAVSGAASVCSFSSPACPLSDGANR
jgi:hypothetical protein